MYLRAGQAVVLLSAWLVSVFSMFVPSAPAPPPGILHLINGAEPEVGGMFPARGLNSSGCHAVLKKAIGLIKFDMERKQTYNRHTQPFQREALEDLARFEADGELLTKAGFLRTMQSLGYVSVHTALQYGDVWTSEDQNLIYWLCGNNDTWTEMPRLEEHAFTYSGDRLFQGDMVDPGCDEDMRGIKGSGYRGCQTFTRSGKKCKPWLKMRPNALVVHPAADLVENFCRNPDGGERTIWCYTDTTTKEMCMPRKQASLLSLEMLQREASEEGDAETAHRLQDQIWLQHEHTYAANKVWTLSVSENQEASSIGAKRVGLYFMFTSSPSWVGDSMVFSNITQCRAGKAIWQGDVIMWSSGEGRRYKNPTKGQWEIGDYVTTEKDCSKAGYHLIRIPNLEKKLWTNNTIAYCYNKETSTAARIAFELAVTQIKAQVACVNFKHVSITNHEACEELPSVMVGSTDSGCWAHVGQVSMFEEKFKSRSQLLNVGPGCELVGMALHQVMHLLGVRHEADRADRDDHIDILAEASVNPKVYNLDFHKYLPLPPPEAYAGYPFDFLSLSMYSSNAFTIDGNDTFVPKQRHVIRRYLGQRMGLSELDVQDIAGMYKCPFTSKPEAVTEYLTKVFMNASELVVAEDKCNDANYTGVQYMDASNESRLLNCWDLDSHCFDGVLGKHVRRACPLLCLQCVPQKIAEVLLSQKVLPTPPPLLSSPKVIKCEDAADSGIRFRTGRIATCKDLAHYCEHQRLGAQIQETCPMSCGKCTIGREAFMNTWAKNEEKWQEVRHCVDKPPDEPPVVTLLNKQVPCDELQKYCANHAQSKYIVAKCGLTCQDFNGCRALLADRANRSNISSYTATTTYTFSEAIYDRTVQVAGCSRRRRWGFCNQRRRRIK